MKDQLRVAGGKYNPEELRKKFEVSAGPSIINSELNFFDIIYACEYIQLFFENFLCRKVI